MHIEIQWAESDVKWSELFGGTSLPPSPCLDGRLLGKLLSQWGILDEHIREIEIQIIFTVCMVSQGKYLPPSECGEHHQILIYGLQLKRGDYQEVNKTLIHELRHMYLHLMQNVLHMWGTFISGKSRMSFLTRDEEQDDAIAAGSLWAEYPIVFPSNKEFSAPHVQLTFEFE